MFTPVTDAKACGVQPAWSAAFTLGASLVRCASVSRQASPRAVKNSPIRAFTATPAAGRASWRCAAVVPWWFPGGSADTAVTGVP